MIASGGIWILNLDAAQGAFEDTALDFRSDKGWAEKGTDKAEAEEDLPIGVDKPAGAVVDRFHLFLSRSCPESQHIAQGYHAGDPATPRVADHAGSVATGTGVAGIVGVRMQVDDFQGGLWQFKAFWFALLLRAMSEARLPGYRRGSNMCGGYRATKRGGTVGLRRFAGLEAAAQIVRGESSNARTWRTVPAFLEAAALAPGENSRSRKRFATRGT